MPCSIVLHFDSTETRLRSRPPHVCMSAPLRCTHSTGSLRLTEPPQPHTAAAGYAEPLTPEQQHQAFLSRLLLMLGSFVIMVRVCLWGGGGGGGRADAVLRGEAADRVLLRLLSASFLGSLASPCCRLPVFL